jgi:cell wall integrity and stress response component
MCTGGGQNAWSVSLDGLSDNVDTFGGSDSGSGASSTGSSSTSGTKTTASPSVITEAGQTIIVTAPGSSKATSQSSSGGPSKAGIAAGVVAGVLAICAAVGGLFFFLRARKRNSVEEAYRRNAAINQFVQGGGKQTSEGSSVNDSRLDPSIMVQRRMSDGSIADNQDYSRRILKVRYRVCGITELQSLICSTGRKPRQP